jgi:hypothetical protein
MSRFADMSRSTKVVLLLGSLLLVLAVTGVMSVSRGVAVEKEEAIALAREEIDFEPTQTTVRLLRQGFSASPSWAVSFSIPRTTGGGFDRLVTVVVSATDGAIVEVNRDL